MTQGGVSDALEVGSGPVGNFRGLVKHTLGQAGGPSFTLEARITNIPLPGVDAVILDLDVCMLHGCGSRAGDARRGRRSEQQQQQQQPQRGEGSGPAAPERPGHGRTSAAPPPAASWARPGRDAPPPARADAHDLGEATGCSSGPAAPRAAFAFAFALAPEGWREVRSGDSSVTQHPRPLPWKKTPAAP